MKQVFLDGQYLLLPVQNGAGLKKIRLWMNGTVQREFDLELSESEIEYWVYLDVSLWKGSTCELSAEPEGNLDPIQCADEIPGGEDLYRELFRPQFHFTSRRGWNNDPNGLIYYQGAYHLFYQHNPFGTRWGNMHWGHAFSPDLLHWQETGDVLYPDGLGTMYSGSGVVDWNNSSGFQSGEHPPLVLFYTAAGGGNSLSSGQAYTQCLAYSVDGGQNWQKYAENPVLGHIRGRNRDPKVIWHAPSQRWVMALYVDNDYALFTSVDLKQWTQVFTYTIPGSTECPDLFELPVDGDPNHTRWILWGASSCYLVGRFDGQVFIIEETVGQQNSSGDSYAAQVWSDIPPEDRRCIQISWLRVNIPEMPFNQQMTFPIELSLRTTPAGLRLHAQPVKEIESLYFSRTSIGARTVLPGENPLLGLGSELMDLRLNVRPDTAQEILFNIRGTRLIYDVRSQTLTLGEKTIGLDLVDGNLDLRVLVDRTSLEIFGAGGKIYWPLGLVFSTTDHDLSLTVTGGKAQINSLEVCSLKSIWK